ncbi:TetR family transcriptional regulator C-terminal domain-containing protein [Actinoplanes bogorensis]|uniref:TetR family transcriptional regulator C-terminal domain-containing protein n=1 Tax=Paractinoplanes bogorensis TaxID=1610840 RepID=A0ABS5Z373_9ACTN|nr:TetR family transcriptional regulator C-terminal domain-containing protein [Actinoplanes bogorensis]
MRDASDPRVLLRATLEELLPLDEQRRTSLRVMTAYYAWSLTDPELAAVFRRPEHPLEDLVAALITAAGARPSIDPAQEADLLVGGISGPRARPVAPAPQRAERATNRGPPPEPGPDRAGRPSGTAERDGRSRPRNPPAGVERSHDRACTDGRTDPPGEPRRLRPWVSRRRRAGRRGARHGSAGGLHRRRGEGRPAHRLPRPGADRLDPRPRADGRLRARDVVRGRRPAGRPALPARGRDHAPRHQRDPHVGRLHGPRQHQRLRAVVARGPRDPEAGPRLVRRPAPVSDQRP